MKGFTFTRIAVYETQGLEDEYREQRMLVPTNAIVSVKEILQESTEEKALYKAGARCELTLLDGYDIYIVQDLETVYDWFLKIDE